MANKKLKNWEKMANGLSRTANSVLSGKHPIEEAKAMVVEGLDSLPGGKKLLRWLIKEVPVVAQLNTEFLAAKARLEEIEGENEEMFLTFEFLRTRVFKGDIDKMRAFQVAAAADAPFQLEEAQEAMIQAVIFDKGTAGLKTLLDAGPESMARALAEKELFEDDDGDITTKGKAQDDEDDDGEEL